jgi:hypothetical protein
VAPFICSDLFTKRYGMNNFITFSSSSLWFDYYFLALCVLPPPSSMTYKERVVGRRGKKKENLCVGEKPLITSCFSLFSFQWLKLSLYPKKFHLFYRSCTATFHQSKKVTTTTMHNELKPSRSYMFCVCM